MPPLEELTTRFHSPHKSQPSFPVLGVVIGVCVLGTGALVVQVTPLAQLAAASTANTTSFQYAASGAFASLCTFLNLCAHDAPTSVRVVPVSSPSTPTLARVTTFATTTPVYAATVPTPPPQPPVIQNITNPIRERVVEKVVTTNAHSDSWFTLQLASLENKLSTQIASVGSRIIPISGPNAPVSVTTFAASQNIGNLSNTTITNPTISGGTISGASISGTVSAAISSALATIGDLTATTLVATNATFTNTTTTNATTTNLAITGTATIGSATGVLQTTSGFVSTIANGTEGQVLKIVGGVPSWALNTGGSGGSSAWATTTNSLAVYTTDPTQTVLIGTSATSTTGNILEVKGNALVRGNVVAQGTASASSFVATSTANSSLPNVTHINSTTTNATTTTFAATFASTTNLTTGALTIGTLSGFLKATTGVIASALVNLATDITGILPVGNGGTGTSTLPTYGKLLVGNSGGGYDYLATSSLGVTSAVWGNITGTLSNQTDLQTAFNAKLSLAAWFATTTNALAEGASNLYFTTARSNSNFANNLAATTTTALVEGANLYYTAMRVAGVIAGTTTDALAQGTTNKYYSTLLFAGSLAGTTTDALNEGATNRYYTDARVNTLLSATDKGFFFSTTSSNYWKTANDFFSTTSASNFLSLNTGNAFSTTSVNYWKLVTDLFSTTSASAFLAGNQGPAFSTSSASYFLSQNTGTSFSTTSATYFAHASTTIPKTYGANTFTNTNTFTGSLTIGSLNGPLDARNGIISATTSIGILYGGTGTTTAPTYGKLLVGNAGGAYDYLATSSLGIISAVWGNITGTLSNQTDLQTVLNAKFDLSAWYATTTNALAEGANNLYFTNSRVQTYLNSVDKGFFFSTTSAQNFLSLNQGGAFSTTSVNYWKSVTDLFSTTSASAFLAVNQGGAFSTSSATNFLSLNQPLAFSTSSASFFLSQNGGNSFSTTSAINFVHASTTIPKTYVANAFTALQTFGNASTTNLSSSYASSTQGFFGALSLGSLSGILKATTGVIASALVNLATDITGILPVGNGGTGWAALAAGAIPYGNGSAALATTTAGTAGQVLSLLNGVPTWTATTTFSSGLSYSSGNVLLNMNSANTWLALQQFTSGASSTLFSAISSIYVGSTATTTIQGNTTGTSTFQGYITVVGTNSTSTFSGNLSVQNLQVAGSATSTHANGINVAAGCFSVNGLCITTAASQWTTLGSNIYYQAGSVFIGTTTPGRTLTVFNTSANPQERVAYDATRYAEFYADASGALNLTTTGKILNFLDGNLYLCDGGACPTTPVQGYPTSFATNGNIVAGGTIYAGGFGPATCPSGMIPVPASPADGQQGFCVDKYEAQTSSGNEVSVQGGSPWVSITQTSARAECIRAGKHLITEKEWQTIAHNVELVGDNWQGGVVATTTSAGYPQMSDGHSDNAPASSLATAADSSPCSGTGQTCDLSTWNSQRRTYKLSNSQYIWDFGGDVWEWVDQTVTNDYPIVNSAAAGWQTCSTSGDGICGNTKTTNDQWYRGGISAVAGFIRGGGWTDGAVAGAFALTLNNAPSTSLTNVGFRCSR